MTSRREELAALSVALRGPERLVTIAGPGGIGKTWTARNAAEDVGRAFSGGTCFVELTELTDREELIHLVAVGFGVRLDGDQVGVPVLAGLVGDRHALLVLDRCELVVQTCADFVAELLRACPRLHVLATSRQPLGITGERVFRLPPLSVPPDASAVDPLTAAAYDAVALFVERAEAVSRGFALTQDNLGAVIALCVKLDGNPLAIELAAARTALLAPEAILDRLDDRHRLLDTGTTDASPQLRSLRASVEATWLLCGEDERALWARLSVFPGDFELDAAEEVCAGDGIDEAAVLDLVDSLLARSVLVRDAGPAVVRYRMLENLRAYGAEQLGPDGLRRWSDRVLEWTERFVVRAGREWFGPRQTTQWRRLGREHANVVAALRKATGDPARAPQALRMVAALEPWWVMGGRITEARHWLAAALGHGTGTEEERARALGLAAWLATFQGDLAAAERLLREVGPRSEMEAAPGDLVIGRAQAALSLAHGAVAAASASLEEVVARATRLGDTAAEAQAWLLVGLTHWLAGRPDEAQWTLDRCTALCQHAGESQVRASALALEALVALDDNRVSSASALVRDALRLASETGDGIVAAFILEVLGWVAFADDDPVRAATLLGAAEHEWRRTGVTPAPSAPLTACRRERLAVARKALGKREFDRHSARGAALSWQETIRYALDETLTRQRPSATGAALTSREVAVAELVARGMSNREIAAALVISVRTVQGHVEHILRKLGFGSRAQIAAWVAQRDVGGAP